MRKINLWSGAIAGAHLVLVLLVLQACKKDGVQQVPVVTITSINKQLLNIGDTLVITGADFNPAPAKNLVSVASVSFPVIGATAGQLSVVVPAGAQSGTLSVGFKGGRATTFPQDITIIGATQPSILAIAPAGAYAGDTIVISGKHFSIPYDRNSVTFNGVATGKIVNVAENELRVVVPDLADSGPVQVTANGQTSQPFAYTVAKADPTEDGGLYWMTLFYDLSDIYDGPGEMTQAYINKGLGNKGLPQSSTIFSNNGSFFPKDPDDYSDKFSPELTPAQIFNFVVNDQQRNAYYLTADAFPFPAKYQLMKLSADHPAPPVAVWSQSFPSPGSYNNYYPYPGEDSYFTAIHYSPIQQLSIDGNTVYIKMGLSDDYYVGDVSAASPQLALRKSLIGDSSAYNLQFGKDYIFYNSANVVPSYDVSYAPPDELRFTRKGSKIIESVPMNYGNNTIVSIQAGHGNDLLIVTRGYDPLHGGTGYTISKFNADSRQMTVLYNTSNWIDGVYGDLSEFGPGGGNTGFLWVGHHIYYACTSGAESGATALHRVDDDGHSAKPVTIYGRMEPLDMGQGFRYCLFLGK